MDKKIENFILNFLEEFPDIIKEEEAILSTIDKLGKEIPNQKIKLGEISDSLIHFHSKLKTEFFQWGILAGKVYHTLELENDK